MKHILFTIIFSILFCMGASAQTDEPKKEKSSADKTQEIIQKAFKYFPIPFAGYATETGLVLGVTKYNAFKIKGKILPDSMIKTSSILAYVYYTQEHQYKVYLNADIMHSDNKFNSKFEFLLLDYPSYYFGVGNENNFDSSYLVDFKNVMIAPSVSYNVYEKIYLGAKYTFNNFINVESLNKEIGDSAIKVNEGLQSGFGLHLTREARNNRITATKGSYLFASYDFYASAFGSEFNYSQFSLDYRYYYSPIKRLTIASQLYTTISSGDVPIQSMPVVGGAYRMRGVYEARYRDNNMLMAQFELRFPIIWIISGATYVGMGQVSEHIKDYKFSDFHYGYGAGLRLLIDKTTSSVLRFDYSFGPAGNTIFIGFNEAF